MKLSAFNFGVPKIGLPPKILLIMKLVIIILISSFMQVSAATFGQQLTFSGRNVTLKTLFKEIRKQTGYEVIYADKTLNDQQKITADFKGTPLVQVLDASLKGLQVTYVIDDKGIVITKKEPSFLDNIKTAFTSIDVHGRVVDEKGSPIIGATARLKDGSQVTVTDAKGNFDFKHVNENAVVVISFIGYNAREVNAVTDMGSIRLEVATSNLDEVQVQAYGESSKRLSIANISSVKAIDIAKSPVQNPLLALQGRVPGIVITQANGYAGSGVNVQIQGQNSIANANSPLYVIDGVPYFSDLPSADPLLAGPKPLNFFDPAMIESIEILKDATATSIYGSRAANGAILITTKKGKAGASVVDINLQQGIGQDSRRLDLLNTQQYLAMRKQAYMNDGLPIPNSATVPDNSNYDLTLYDQNRYTDWQKVLLGGTAHYTNLNGNVSGGNTFTQFYLGGSFKRQTAVIPGDFADQNGSLHFNICNTSENRRFKITFSGDYQADVNNIIQRDPANDAIILAPNAPALYNADGSLNWAPVSSDGSTISSFINPLAYVRDHYSVNTNNVVSNLSLAYHLLKGLELKTTFGYSRLGSEEKDLTPLEVERPERRNDYSRGSIFQNSHVQTYSISPQVNYKRNISKGILDLIIGSDIQESKSFGQFVAGAGYTSDLLIGDIGSAASQFAYTSVSSQYRYNALFGIARYNWEDKYLLELAGRRDGSSRFGPANRFHDFTSLSGGWLFSNESFIKDNLHWLSFGKVKASYGTSGNDGIGDYKYLANYTANGVNVPYQGIVGLLPENLPNPYLQWEQTNKLNLGLELGFVKDRIFLTLNYFRNRSGNQLLEYRLPYTTGFTDIAQNFPALVQNTGFEFTLNTTNIESSGFKWTSSLNLTVPSNKLLSFPGLALSSYANRLVIGKPVNIAHDYSFAGVDPETGMYQYRKADGSLTSDQIVFPSDYTGLLDINPKFYGGFTNSFSFKGFTLDVLFYFNKQMATGTDGYTYGNSLAAGRFGDSRGNQTTGVLKAWMKPGDQAVNRKYTTLDPDDLAFLGNSSIGYTDVSYIRLKNVSLSWQLPASLVNRMHLQRARIYFQGQNLLTITSFKGLDPETVGSNILPPLQVITMGIQITF
jgi:TonB-linked SusC/RagA family outer membrane protein